MSVLGLTVLQFFGAYEGIPVAPKSCSLVVSTP